LPIGGATAPEEGGKGSELGEVNVSVGSSSSTGEEGEEAEGLGTHVLTAALYTQSRPHGFPLGQAKASDAIPKKRAKQNIKAIM
jgi:hypothetical protein